MLAPEWDYDPEQELQEPTNSDRRPRNYTGAVGLRNHGNTCYLNSVRGEWRGSLVELLPLKPQFTVLLLLSTSYQRLPFASVEQPASVSSGLCFPISAAALRPAIKVMQQLFAIAPVRKLVLGTQLPGVTWQEGDVRGSSAGISSLRACAASFPGSLV